MRTMCARGDQKSRYGECEQRRNVASLTLRFVSISSQIAGKEESRSGLVDTEIRFHSDGLKKQIASIAPVGRKRRHFPCKSTDWPRNGTLEL